MATDTAEKLLSPETEGPEHTRTGQFYRPRVDIVELPQELVITAEMPGLANDLIDIQFEDGTLSIHGRAPARQPSNTRYLLQEFGVGDFYRTFRVSEAIDASRISAEYGDGLLTLHLPKAEALRPRKISVNPA